MHPDHPTIKSSHTSTFEVIVLETAPLGGRPYHSAAVPYIAHDSLSAGVIDPQRGIDRIEAELTNEPSSSR